MRRRKRGWVGKGRSSRRDRLLFLRPLGNPRDWSRISFLEALLREITQHEISHDLHRSEKLSGLARGSIPVPVASIAASCTLPPFSLQNAVRGNPETFGVVGESPQEARSIRMFTVLVSLVHVHNISSTPNDRGTCEGGFGSLPSQLHLSLSEQWTDVVVTAREA